MTEIVVKVQIDLSAETKTFLSRLFPHAACPCGTVGMGEESEQVKKADPQPKVDETASTSDPQPEVKPVPTSDPQPEAKPAPTPQPEAPKKAYKIEEVRAAMSSKLADHRVEMVNKLKEMGAKNVSTLPEDKYEEFINFCNAL